MFKWEKSSGCEVGQVCNGLLYVQRAQATKVVSFVRLSWGKNWRIGTRYVHTGFMLGLFKGRTNHMNTPGYEVFGTNWHVAWLKKPVRGTVKYSGSSVKPYTTVSFAWWRCMVGCSVPKWVQRVIGNREAAKWEKSFAAYEAAHPEMFVGEPNQD